MIKPDGSLTVESHPEGKIIYATGTWTMKANILYCEFVYQNALPGYPVTQKTSAIYDSTGGKLTNGVWENIDALNGTGAFNMVRVNK